MRPSRVEELGGDVAGPVDVDDPGRPPSGRNTARRRPVSSTASTWTPVRRAGQGAEQLADQGIALEPAHAGDRP